MSCKDNKDGSCTVEYVPFTPGDYDVNITFGGQPIPGGQRGRGRLWEDDDGMLSSWGKGVWRFAEGKKQGRRWIW